MCLFSKHAWIVPLKDKKGVTIVNAFQSILDSSKRKPNKHGLINAVNSVSYFKKWLENNGIKMYST